MKKLLLNISVLSMSVCLATGAIAETKSANKPIFITPYSPNVPTYETRVPNMVRSKGQSAYSQNSRSYTSPNRVSYPQDGPTYDPVVNPFPAGYGRIRSEQDFYDSETEQYYGQYEYFKLLADRGETEKLQQLVKEVQEGGVFDPEKYKSVMSGGSDSGGTSTPRTQYKTVVKGASQNKQVTKNLKESDIPQKIHKGYDDESDLQPAYRKNQPIFLK